MSLTNIVCRTGDSFLDILMQAAFYFGFSGSYHVGILMLEAFLDCE